MDPALRAAYRLWAEVNDVTREDAIRMAGDHAELANIVRLFHLRYQRSVVVWQDIVEALSE